MYQPRMQKFWAMATTCGARLVVLACDRAQGALMPCVTGLACSEHCYIIIVNDLSHGDYGEARMYIQLTPVIYPDIIPWSYR